ncbi:MAG: class I SAM-dependent methyltransferase [Alphaproteobacteria bacterium]|nr:class I SAM-dependent methyltransferase [Alphaproteobacteria bacterium]
MNHELRAAAILKRVKPGQTVVEVGVFRGEMTELLALAGVNVIMVDDWLPGHSQPLRYRRTGDYHTKLGTPSINRARRQAKHIASQYAGLVSLLEMRSVDAARHTPDRSIDLVFLDADHSYEGVKQDWHEWLPKVVPGGYIGGHDYGDKRFGVKRAVDESLAFWHKLELDNNLTWFVQQ